MAGGPGQARLDRRAAEELEWARWAVGRWSGFPVERTPRPVVLLDARVRIENGFATAEAKSAFIEGRVDSSVAIPAGVLAEVARQGRAGSGHPLLITAAEPTEADFATDRGPQRLPAWRLTAEDVLGPIWVLDPGVADWRPTAGAGGPPPDLQPPPQDPGACVEVGPDDRTLALHWLGGAPEFEQYPTAEVVESAQAFTVVPVGVDVGPTGWRTLAGHVHRVPATLRQPLGARVFVDLHGDAGRVIRTAGSV